jgi:Staphylococcal nuclease homologue
MDMTRLLPLVALAVLLTLAATAAAARLPRGGTSARIEYVIDGDTVQLTNGRRVRLVQIDTPEVYNVQECYGKQASKVTERLLRAGRAVRLYREPKTDAVDDYRRLLRYVVRARDGLDVQHPARAGGCGGAVLLRLPARAVRAAARPPGPPCAGAAPRPVGAVSRHTVGPEPRRLDRAAAVERASSRDGPCRDRTCDLGIKSPLLYQLS